MADIQTFRDELSDLLGFTPTEANAKELLVRACYDVVNRFKQVNPDILNDFATEATLSDGNGYDLISNFVYAILDVVREDEDENLIPCIKIPAKLRQQAAEDSGSIYESSKSSPIFYELNGELFVLPDPLTGGTPADNEEAYISLVKIADIVTNYDSSTSSITGFPASYNHFIILYAAYHLLLQKIVSYVDDSEIGDAVDAIETSTDKLDDFIKLILDTSGDPNTGIAFDAAAVLKKVDFTDFDDAIDEVSVLMSNDGDVDWEDWRGEEDSELMQAVVNGVQVRLAEAKSELDKNMAYIQQASASAGVAQSVMSGTDAIQKEISGRLGEIKSRVDEITANRKIYTENAMALKDRYERLFIPFGIPKSEDRE